MAAGAWAGKDVAGWTPGDVVAVAPVLGDLLLVTSADEPPLADVSHGLTAIYQHDRDRYWIGGTSRTDGPLGEATGALEQQLLEGARSLMPGWTNLSVVARRFLVRPAAPGRLPVAVRS